MSREESKEIVRRCYDEVINHKNLVALDGVLAGDFRHNGEMRGRDGQRRAVSTILTAFPDIHVAIDDLIAEGDRVVARETWSGTHRGSFMDVPPTGKRAVWSAIALLRIAGGKIFEPWVNPDDLGLLPQLGAVTAPPQSRG